MASRNGLIVRDAEAYEAALSLKAFVFDKTGTLTTGRPAVFADTEVAVADAPVAAAAEDASCLLNLQ